MSETNIRSGTITAIEPQQRDQQRVSIFLDGQFAFGIDVLIAADLGLRVGRQLSERDLDALRAADEISRATQSALRLLGYRARSTQEIRDRLGRRGFSAAAIEATIVKLDDWRYLDDEQFAVSWVESRANHQPKGKRLLRQELIRKGIDRTTVEQAVANAALDEQAMAIEQARGRLPALQGLDPLVQRRRLAGYLQRRGYGWEIVRKALDEVLVPEGDGEPD